MLIILVVLAALAVLLFVITVRLWTDYKSIESYLNDLPPPQMPEELLEKNVLDDY